MTSSVPKKQRIGATLADFVEMCVDNNAYCGLTRYASNYRIPNDVILIPVKTNKYTLDAVYRNNGNVYFKPGTELSQIKLEGQHLIPGCVQDAIKE